MHYNALLFDAPELSGELSVLSDGSVALPLVGSVRLSGLTLQQASEWMRTLLAEPDALLMDEAFSALDPELRQGFGGFVRAQIRDRGIPALLVSHDAADAAFADAGTIHI